MADFFKEGSVHFQVEIFMGDMKKIEVGCACKGMRM